MRAICVTVVLVFLGSTVAGAATDYTLDDLFKLALARSEKLKISEQDVVIAEGQKEKALSLLLPSLTGSGGYTRYKDKKYSDSGSLIQPYDSPSWSLRAEQSMSLGGRELVGLSIAKEGIRRSQSDLWTAREGYMLGVAAAYVEYVRAKRILDINRSNVERLTKYRDAAGIRLRVGEVTKTVLLRAEAELSAAVSEFLKASNRIALSKAVLARVAGIEADYDVLESDELSLEGSRPDDANILHYCPELTSECLKQRAVSERSEVKGSEIQAKIASDQVRFAKGAYWPTLALEGVYQRKNETPETSGIVRENLYGGVRLSLPLFEGGFRDAEIREAQARQRQADLSLRDLKKTVGIEVESAYLFYDTQKGILKSVEDEYRFARENYGAVARQFEYGLVTSLDVLDANTALVSAERNRVDAIYNYKLAALALERVVGVLLKRIAAGSGGGPGTMPEAAKGKGR
jgi:outer membrane protein